MDFFNRVRKIKTPNNDTIGDFDNRNIKLSDPPMIQSGYNLNANGTINKSRKVYKLSKGHSQTSHAIDSGGGEEHDSGGENLDHHSHQKKMHQIQPHHIRSIVHKQPISPMSSNGLDSGLESAGKRPVTQTDSNTSTGSMLLHNNNIKSDLERKLAINSLANKRDTQTNELYGRYRKPVHEFRKTSVSSEQHLEVSSKKSVSDVDLYNDKKPDNYKKKKKKTKANQNSTSVLALSGNALKDNNNYIKVKYPPLSTSTGQLNHSKSASQLQSHGYSESEDSDDSYIEDIEKKNIKSILANKDQLEKLYTKDNKHKYASREDFADDEHDEDAKSSGSSNNGHVHVKDPPIITNHDVTPIVETTAIISKKPVKIELSNQSSLGGILDSGHSSPLHVTTSNSDKDCSCTTTSSEFHSSHHQCCSSDTSNSIKNIGNNNNNKKIIEASITTKNSIKKDEIKEKQKIEKKDSLITPNRNKQYPNNSNTVATFHSNIAPRNSISNQVKQGEYSYTNKFAATIAKVPSTNKVQPTSKRVNGVTLRDLYSLRAVLSDSDNGTVFSGRRRIDNAAVAIKRIMKGKVKRWHMIKEKSVPMEIALLRKVNETRHAGVVTLLEWFECSDCFLLVMARPTPVLDLFDYVSEKKRLDESTSKMIFVQVVEAMVHCHQRSVLHRDIKLENILVKTDTLISTIIDFGCGTHLHSNLYKDFAGTPQYYPPEYYICKQYHGLPAAVWSVGVMLYAMLCGRLPFASAHEIVHLEPSWHGSFCRKISPAAKDLVEHMLKKQPRRRLQMSDILNHRWLKNAKYDSATGDVTLTAELTPSYPELQNTSNRDMAMGQMSENTNINTTNTNNNTSNNSPMFN